MEISHRASEKGCPERGKMAKKKKKRTEYEGCLYQFAIYRSPDDYPGRLVGRWWKVDKEGIYPALEPLVMPDESEESMEELRKIPLSNGLIPFGKAAGDEKCIEEVWI